MTRPNVSQTILKDIRALRLLVVHPDDRDREELDGSTVSHRLHIRVPVAPAGGAAAWY